MTSPALDKFVAEAVRLGRALNQPADCVLALAPLMLELIGAAGSFLEPAHYASHADHYTRKRVDVAHHKS